jgi:SAM-dependent methyltransferase
MSPPAFPWLSRAWRNWVLVPAGYGRPIPPAVADREYREGHWVQFTDAAELPRFQAVASLVSASAQPVKVLDLGCGNGRLAQCFPPGSVRRYLGVDFSPEGIRQARALALSGCEFLVGDFQHWRTTERFDLLVFGESLGYADDPAAVLRTHLPCLAPDGRVIVSQFRFGPWPALWRRIEQPLQPMRTTTVRNERGQIWDVKLLRPRSA